MQLRRSDERQQQITIILNKYQCLSRQNIRYSLTQAIKKQKHAPLLKNKKKIKNQSDIALPHKISHSRIAIQNREVVINESRIKRYKQQYNKLKKRQKYLSVNFTSIRQADQNYQHEICSARRNKLQNEINQTIKNIQKTKKSNNDIRRRSKTLQKDMDNTDQIFDQLKRLKIQLQLKQKHKQKLSQKIHQTSLSITQLNNKLLTINQKHTNIQTTLNTSTQQQKSQPSSKSIQIQLSIKNQRVDSIKKSKQKLLQSKQLTHKKLAKELELKKQIINSLDNRINQMELNTIEAKNVLGKLRTQWKQWKEKRENFGQGEMEYKFNENKGGDSEQEDILAPYCESPLRKSNQHEMERGIVSEPKKESVIGNNISSRKQRKRKTYETKTSGSVSMLCYKKQSSNKARISHHHDNASQSTLEREWFRGQSIAERSHIRKQQTQSKNDENNQENQFQIENYEEWQKSHLMRKNHKKVEKVYQQ